MIHGTRNPINTVLPDGFLSVFYVTVQYSGNNSMIKNYKYLYLYKKRERKLSTTPKPRPQRRLTQAELDAFLVKTADVLRNGVDHFD